MGRVTICEMRRRLIWSVAVLVATGAILLVIVEFIGLPTVVVGDSMVPTLRSWDVCWMQRVHPYAPARGDIIMFRTADDPPLRFIKRVVALSGETIAIQAGQVFINSQPLPEPYTTINLAWSLAATNVPAGRVYVIGDNREVPMDLAVYGLVATRLVQAKMAAHWRWRK